MPATTWAPVPPEKKIRPLRKSCATPPGTPYSPVTQPPSHGLAFATGAMAPPGAHAGASTGTPSVLATCGHAWCISNCQYGHEWVPDGR